MQTTNLFLAQKTTFFLDRMDSKIQIALKLYDFIQNQSDSRKERKKISKDLLKESARKQDSEINFLVTKAKQKL